MKTLSRDEMKKVMGGEAPVGNGKCCFIARPTDCSTCMTGLHCNGDAVWSAC